MTEPTVPWRCSSTEVVLFSIIALKHKHFTATHLRCGGIFSDSIITNVLLMLTVKKFENRLIFDEVKACKIKCASFLATLYMSTSMLQWFQSQKYCPVKIGSQNSSFLSAVNGSRKTHPSSVYDVL